MSQPTRFGVIERWYTGTADLPVKGPLPKGTTLTGKFSTNGTIVTGTGTKFNSEIGAVRGWLYSTSLNQLREFNGVANDGYLYLMSPFTSNVANDNVVVCFIKYTLITIENLGTNPGTVKERAFPVGGIETYPNEGGIEPLAYDFTDNGVSGSLILLQH